MPAIGGLFAMYLLVQTLLSVVAFRLARRREDAATALGVLVFPVASSRRSPSGR